MIFKNRKAAGLKLADKLKKYQGAGNVVLLALPRGGVPIAHEVAQKTGIPLDIITVKKLSAPYNPEFAIGAIAPESIILDDDAIRATGASDEYLDKEKADKAKENKRRADLYRGGVGSIPLSGKTAIIVDDGIATGSTMLVAVKSAKTQGAKKVIVAVPVASNEAIKELQNKADEVIVLEAPDYFMAVGQFYEEFPQVRDEEVIEFMRQNRQ